MNCNTLGQADETAAVMEAVGQVPEHSQSREEVDAVLVLWAKEAARRKRRTGRGIAIYICVGLFLLIGVPLLHWLATGHAGSSDAVVMIAAFSGLLTAAKTLTDEQKKAVASVVALDVVRAVGPLIDIATSPDKGNQAVARERLVALVPRMTPDDAHTLSPEHMKYLLGRLSVQDARADEPMALAVLAALEHVGDARAVTLLEQILDKNEERLYPARLWSPAVEAESQRILPIITERLKQQEESGRLLRSATTGGTEDLLLRAQSASTEVSGNLLLPVDRP